MRKRVGCFSCHLHGKARLAYTRRANESNEADITAGNGFHQGCYLILATKQRSKADGEQAGEGINVCGRRISEGVGSSKPIFCLRGGTFFAGGGQLQQAT